MEAFIKRLFDLTCSAIGMILLSPLYLVIYVVLKVTCPGPALFSQERIGLGGRPFLIYKFRTIIVNGEPDGIPRLAEPGDERLTTVGKFLRKHHLDELPQLWNVFRGDMSLIGPRPERQYFINQIMAVDPRYAELYKIRPGVTSYATLYNGYTDTLEKMLRRLELDLYYMEHRSWWFDIKILFHTFQNIVFGKVF